MTHQTNDDFYQIEQNCIDRLIREWKQYGTLIIAFDYDNTIFDYSDNKNSCERVIAQLHLCKELGFHLILFTSCNDDRIPEIVEYMNTNGIPFDSINETPDYIPYKGRKVYYNHLLDDRSGLKSAVNILDKVIYTIRGIQHNKYVDDIG